MLRAAPCSRFPNPDRFRPELRLPTTASSDLRNLVLKIGPIWSSRLPIPSPSLTSVTSFKRFPIQKTNSFSFRPQKVLGLQYSLASFMFTKTFNPEKPNKIHSTLFYYLAIKLSDNQNIQITFLLHPHYYLLKDIIILKIKLF